MEGGGAVMEAVTHGRRIGLQRFLRPVRVERSSCVCTVTGSWKSIIDSFGATFIEDFLRFRANKGLNRGAFFAGLFAMRANRVWTNAGGHNDRFRVVHYERFKSTRRTLDDRFASLHEIQIHPPF